MYLSIFQCKKMIGTNSTICSHGACQQWPDHTHHRSRYLTEIINWPSSLVQVQHNQPTWLILYARNMLSVLHLSLTVRSVRTNSPKPFDNTSVCTVGNIITLVKPIKHHHLLHTGQASQLSVSRQFTNQLNSFPGDLSANASQLKHINLNVVKNVSVYTVHVTLQTNKWYLTIYYYIKVFLPEAWVPCNTRFFVSVALSQRCKNTDTWPLTRVSRDMPLTAQLALLLIKINIIKTKNYESFVAIQLNINRLNS